MIERIMCDPATTLEDNWLMDGIEKFAFEHDVPSDYLFWNIDSHHDYAFYVMFSWINL